MGVMIKFNKSICCPQSSTFTIVNIFLELYSNKYLLKFSTFLVAEEKI